MSQKKKKEETKPKPIDLKLTLENFGPLRKAEIELKPMTIFIGPNNSGKSYVAMMFYSLFSAVLRTQSKAELRPFAASPLISEDAFGDMRKKLLQEAEPILRTLRNLPSNQRLEIDDAFVQNVLQNWFCANLSGILAGNVRHSYGTDLHGLVRSTQDHFRMRIITGEIGLSYMSSEHELKILHQSFGRIYLDSAQFARELRTWRHMLTNAVEFDPSDPRQQVVLMNYVSAEATRQFTRGLPTKQHFLPAPRSALLQVYKPLISSVFRQMGRAGYEVPEIPAMTGVASDFMSFLTELPLPEGPLTKVEIQLSEDLIRGRIVLEIAHPNLLPSFLYEFEGGRIPLYRASSSVSELAPLFLCLRYAVKPGDVLIIDEPEAHLHPGAIRILAKYLVRLVREGVNLILTTHSDYLLGQINNYILAGSVRQKGASKRAEGDSDVYLDREEVACYLFKPGDAPEEGFSTEELKADDDGFPEEEFTKVARAMYNQGVRLRNRMMPEKRLADVLEG